MSRTSHHSNKGMYQQNKGYADFRYPRDRQRKAKVKQCLKNKEYENIPTFKKDHMWWYW